MQVVVFTGMNDDGDFYVNKRVSASSGNDRVFETPLVRVLKILIMLLITSVVMS